MRRSSAILALLLALTATACGGSDDKASDDKTPSSASTRLETPSDPMSSIGDVACTQYAGAAQKIAEAQQELYTSGMTDPSKAEAAVKTLTDQLEAFKDGAPDDVQTAIDDLVEAFRAATDVLKEPTSAAAEKLRDLGTRLAASGQKVSTYIATKCAGS